MSGLHARIYNVEEGFWVEDLGSTNGTLINGAVLVEPTQVTEGQSVQFGNLVCTLEMREDFHAEVAHSASAEKKAPGPASPKEAPRHTMPSAEAVNIYRRKTSRVDFDKFTEAIQKADDYSDSKPLPSKYELTDSGRIARSGHKRKREQDFTFKPAAATPVPNNSVPWKAVLVSSIIAAVLCGFALGYWAARMG